MKLIVGLGNPEEKYNNTRHNTGFLAIDQWQTENNFPQFALNTKFNALISESNFRDEKIILAKPQTYMNKSGQAVKAISDYYKILASDIWVIHDDIDLALGTIRISTESGSAGHKGVQSIIDELNAKNFIRFRIGIRPPVLKTDTEKFVLQKFTREEEKIIEDIIKKTTEVISVALNFGIEKAMGEFN